MFKLYKGLFRVLRKANVAVEKIPTAGLFSMKNVRVFHKQELVCKRCVEVKTGAVYLFNPLAEVYPVS